MSKRTKSLKIWTIVRPKVWKVELKQDQKLEKEMNKKNKSLKKKQIRRLDTNLVSQKYKEKV